MNNIFLENYNNIFKLCKNCTSNQIYNYFINYENKEELNTILKLEDIFGNTPFNILFRNNNVEYFLIDYIISNFELLNDSNTFRLYPLNYSLEFLPNKKKIIKLIIDNSNLHNIIDINENNIYHHITLLKNINLLGFIKYIYYKYKLYNFDEKNKLGYTPLMYACDSNLFEIINFLLSINCDFNIRNNNNNTCLMYLCMNNNEEGIKKIINNVDINIKDNQGDSALSYLCGCDIKSNCNLNLIKYLINLGADYNTLNKENNSLLIYATGVFSRYLDFKIDINILKYLINLGIDINIKNNNNKTFLDYLAIKDINILKELLNDKLILLSDNIKLKYNYLFDLDIDRSQIKVIKENNNSECIICLENFNKDDEILKCCNNHYYHSNCLVKWFKNNNYNLKCPTCTIDFEFNNNIIKI